MVLRILNLVIIVAQLKARICENHVFVLPAYEYRSVLTGLLAVIPRGIGAAAEGHGLVGDGLPHAACFHNIVRRTHIQVFQFQRLEHQVSHAEGDGVAHDVVDLALFVVGVGVGPERDATEVVVVVEIHVNAQMRQAGVLSVVAVVVVISVGFIEADEHVAGHGFGVIGSHGQIHVPPTGLHAEVKGRQAVETAQVVGLAVYVNSLTT